MFERFTDRARKCLVQAEQEAGLLGHSWIGTEHLLLGVAVEGGNHGAEALVRHGLDAVRVRAELIERLAAMGHVTVDDASALARLGIDLEAVRTTVEATFGEGALSLRALEGIPFTYKAKHALELAAAAAATLVQDHIAPEHLVLGMLDAASGVAFDILTATVEPAILRAELVAGIEERRTPDDRAVVDVGAARVRTLVVGYEPAFAMLRTDHAEGAPIVLDLRATDADRTRVIDQATGFAAGLGADLVRLTNGVYLLMARSQRLTPEARRDLLATLVPPVTG